VRNNWVLIAAILVTGLKLCATALVAPRIAVAQPHRIAVAQPFRAVRGSSGQQRTIFRSETTTVSVNVAVQDGRRPVPGLTAADFELTDAGMPQEVNTVDIEAVPIDVTLIVDTSTSATDEADRFRNNTGRIAAFLRDQDRLRLLTIDTYVHEILPMQPARTVSLPGRMQTGGMTSAYDALVAAMITRVDLDRRHLIVAMTDAWDTMSVLDAQDVLDVAGRSEAALHIALATESSGAYKPFPARPLYHDQDLDALREATVRTGGGLHTSAAVGPNDVVEMFRKVFDDFRVSYILHYTPTGVARNGWHPLKVSVPGHPQYVVRARQGYFGG
jgi:VWFA-related protein